MTMTKLEAQTLLQNVILQIERDLELSPGMIDRVLFRDYEYPGDPLARELKKLICAKLDPEAVLLLSAETEPARWC